MSTYKYGDDRIRTRDIMVAIPSMAFAVGIIRFPRVLAAHTTAADGWVPILLAGLIAILLTWMVAKLAANFPNQTFLTYASTLVTKPIAIVLSLLYVLQGVFFSSFQIRAISDISKQYLFDRTPEEVIALTFLLVVVYAVSGSRSGIFRLNFLFLPIIFIAIVFLIFISIGFMEGKNVLPVFKTDINGYIQGLKQSTLSFTGIGILFFYIAYVRQPKNAPKMAALGMSWVVVMYIIIHITCIAVFGDITTANLRYPLIELAQSVEIPGGFFERLESVFFAIWIMAIFNTSAMALDICVIAASSIFKKAKKIKIIFILSPIIYLISTIPKNYIEIANFGNYMSYYSWGLSVTTAILLWVMYKVKGAKQKNGKK